MFANDSLLRNCIFLHLPVWIDDIRRRWWWRWRRRSNSHHAWRKVPCVVSREDDICNSFVGRKVKRREVEFVDYFLKLSNIAKLVRSFWLINVSVVCFFSWEKYKVVFSSLFPFGSTRIFLEKGPVQMSIFHEPKLIPVGSAHERHNPDCWVT